MKTLIISAFALVMSAATFTAKASAEEKFARAYASHNYQGPPSLKIYPNQLWLAFGDDYWNDQIDSVKVPDGCVLTVREHSHKNSAGSRKHGERLRIRENNRNLRNLYDDNGRNWHDRISQMMLRCRN